MSITAQWDNQEKTVIRLDFVQPWNWADLANGDKQMVQLGTSVTHAVNMIVNLNEAGVLPRDALGRIRASMATTSQLPMPMHSVVVVGANLLDQSITLTAQKTLRSAHELDIQFVATLDEARTLLKAG